MADPIALGSRASLTRGSERVHAKVPELARSPPNHPGAGAGVS